MIKKILLTLFLFFVISESSFGKSYLCMSEKMGMYGWSKNKGWQSFGMDDNVGTTFILKLTKDESKIKSLNRLKPKQTLCIGSESSVFYTDFPAEKILRCGEHTHPSSDTPEGERDHQPIEHRVKMTQTRPRLEYNFLNKPQRTPLVSSVDAWGRLWDFSFPLVDP